MKTQCLKIRNLVSFFEFLAFPFLHSIFAWLFPLQFTATAVKRLLSFDSSCNHNLVSHNIAELKAGWSSGTVFESICRILQKCERSELP